jgi:hypothetical protein
MAMGNNDSDSSGRSGRTENGDRVRAQGPHSFPTWKGATIMVAVIIAFFVLREHWGHVLWIAPYLLRWPVP